MMGVVTTRGDAEMDHMLNSVLYSIEVMVLSSRVRVIGLWGYRVMGL